MKHLDGDAWQGHKVLTRCQKWVNKREIAESPDKADCVECIEEQKRYDALDIGTGYDTVPEGEG